jgi:hypothetical protein
MAIKKTILILSLIILITSTNVWALTWDPDAEATLGFNMNFEIHTAYTTTDAVAGTVGVLKDYNMAPSWDPDSFWEIANGIRGTSANFDHLNDRYPWGICPNDVNITIGVAGTAHPEIGVFELGWPAEKHSYAFWFNTPNLIEGTFIRYAHRWVYDPGYSKQWWEIRINAGKLEIRHGQGFINMVTTEPLSVLGAPKVPDNNGWIDPCSTGVDPNTWHHAIVVIDRFPSKTASKIYIDGLEVPVTIVGCNDAAKAVVDDSYKSPVRIGTGEYEFDGMLDEIRIYDKALTPLEACVLYQYDVDDINEYAIALNPLLREVDVNMVTSLDWDPALDATKQEIYFGTDPEDLNLVKIGDGSLNEVNNVELTPQHMLEVSTKYYWRVDSTIGVDGPVIAGHVWSFTTGTGKAEVVSPCNWTTSVTATSERTFDVYFSANYQDVEDGNVACRLVHDYTGTNVACSCNSVGETYYWRVDVNYTPITTFVLGDVWSFRTEPYKIYFNTSNAGVSVGGHVIGAYGCHIEEAGSWTNTGVTGSKDNAGVAVFNFPSDFNCSKSYDIIVIPEHTPNNDADIPAPLGIHVNGNFYFNGKMDISGDDGNSSFDPESEFSPKARCGGHRGPRKEVYPGSGCVSRDVAPPDPYGSPTGYYYWYCNQWDDGTCISYGYGKTAFETRYGLQQGHRYYTPIAGGYSVFGPGAGSTAPYKVGGGGGYGGKGGDSGRGYYHGIFAGGASYGDKEVPVPFGGSAGSWSQHASGAAGGGGVEIIAAGNVTLGANAQILSNGGTNSWKAPQYPAGGGSGGSVKIIADGSFTNDGIISVNGGKGQDNGEKGNNTGGGGAGGRVAVFYGGTCMPANPKGGNITATGGDKGVTLQGNPEHEGLGLARKGDDGTIYVVDSIIVDPNDHNEPVSPKKASAPTPRHGDPIVYGGDTNEVTLQWYSGYGATTGDQAFFGPVDGPNVPIGSLQTAARGQKTCDEDVNVVPGDSYYWYVVTDGTVKSDVWEFSVVDWECNEPDWETYAAEQTLNPEDANMMMAAGWPAWDINHDCVVNDLDFWFFAKDWRVNVSGHTYMLDITNLEIYTSEWMTCRARTNNGCDGWPLTPDWIHP